MANPTIKIRPKWGTQPWEELDVTERVMIEELEPEDYDAAERSDYGVLVRTKRAMRRRFRVVELQRLTVAEMSRMRRWKHNRTQLALNPNWNDKTVFLAEFQRAMRATGSPGVVIGPLPTFTRTISNANTSATRQSDDARLQLIAQNIPRYEQSAALSPFYPLTGIRLYGKHTNYLAKSHPANGDLLWTLTNTTGNATYSWVATLESAVIDISPGVAVFRGDNTDYISRSVTPPSGQISACAWLKGEGTVSLQFTGGATGESSTMTLQSNTWQLLKLENIASSGAAVTVRINAKSSNTWCSVCATQLNGGRRVRGYIHNQNSSTGPELQEDGLLYAVQVPYYGFTLQVGLEVPPLVAAGEQPILGVDAGGGNAMVLKYDGGIAKYYFQKKTGSFNVQWTPVRAAGQGTVIAIAADRAAYTAYENNSLVGFQTTNVLHTLVSGLNIGWDGITDGDGWNGLVFFVRIDEGTAGAEIAYTSDLYNNADQLAWARSFRGRLFEITSERYVMRAGQWFSTWTFEEVDSYETATYEDP